MQDIVIKTVDKSKIRNNGIGDYRTGINGNLVILVAKMKNDDEEFLVALHELIESKLALKRGINFKDINSFDRKHLNSPEPGDRKDAPYHEEHEFANKIEGMMAEKLGIKDYFY